MFYACYDGSRVKDKVVERDEAFCHLHNVNFYHPLCRLSR